VKTIIQSSHPLLSQTAVCTHLEGLSEEVAEVGEAGSGLFWSSTAGAEGSSPCADAVLFGAV